MVFRTPEDPGAVVGAGADADDELGLDRAVGVGLALTAVHTPPR